MRLRCIRGGFGSPFKEGRIYDVAEIMEWHGHAIVRKPNGQWPKPGDRWFGWHPEEWFASPSKGLEILSCGYLYEDMECYGVIIPASRYKHIPRFRALLERVMDKITDTMGCLWYLHYAGVRTERCSPELERRFCVVGAYHQHLGRETSYKDAARAIRRVLGALGMGELAKGIDDLEFDFWYKYWRQVGGLTWRNRLDR